MSSLSEVHGKIVLVRVAYDLPSLEDTSRIYDSISTIKLLLEQNNTLVLSTKWGRPKNQEESLSTQNLLTILSSILSESLDSDQVFQLNFIDQFISFENARNEVLQAHKSEFKNNIFLLENTHFVPEETSKDSLVRLHLAEKYAGLAEVFVDEAFPSSHRIESTNTEIKTLLPSYLGFGYEQELENLNKLKQNPQTPFYIVMAGAKLETKLPLLVKMAVKADKIFVGGMLAFTLIVAKKELQNDLVLPELFDSPVEINFLEQAKELLLKYPYKFELPLDFVYNKVDDKTIARDVGEMTIQDWSDKLSSAKTIFWNGTLGQYEVSPFDRGTLELAGTIVQLVNCFKVVGGGDTSSSLPSDILNKFDFVSMGGGATLEYLSN